MTTSFQVHGTVNHFSNHGDHATVGVSVDYASEGNAGLLEPAEGEPAGSPYLSFKVGEEDAARPELAEGSTVTLTFAAAPAAAEGGTTDPANKPKTSAAKSS